jgi:hypothetical protein
LFEQRDYPDAFKAAVDMFTSMWDRQPSFEATKAFPEKLEPQESSAGLSLRDVVPDCVGADDPKVTYKSKVRVVFRNDTQDTLLISRPGWEAGAVGLTTQKPFFSGFNLEGPNGWQKEDWQKESSTIRAEPNRVFRVWIGFQLDILQTLRRPGCNP